MTGDGEARGRMSALESYLHVLHALMLRDMRTRFGASLWGYAIVVLWPCVHLGFLVAIYTFQKLPIPTGGPAPIFFASGALPLLIFQYISREVMKALLLNRPLTYFPQVKLFDVVFARVLVEIVSGFLSLMVVVGILTGLGYDVWPAQPFVAMCGYCAAILMGIGIGTVNVAIVSFWPGWMIGYILFNIIMYVASGVMFMSNYFPDRIYYWLKFNPCLHLVEWVRSAYYPAVGLQVDYIYVLLWALTSATLGLLMLKHIVGKVQAG